MRARFINEFERGLEPKTALDIGSNSTNQNKIRFAQLVELGVDFNYVWDTDGEELEKTYKHIKKLEKAVFLLHENGVDYKNMHISHYDAINIKGYKINNNGHIIAECLTFADAEYLRDAFGQFNIGTYIKGLVIEENDWGGYFKYLNSDQEQWLENYKENREKIIKNKTIR